MTRTDKLVFIGSFFILMNWGVRLCQLLLTADTVIANGSVKMLPVGF